MVIHHRVADGMDWKHCTTCGLKIKVLGDAGSLAVFMGAATVQRRGFRCANCGQVTCYHCSTIECRCSCNSNAWVAMPYLASDALGTGEPVESYA